MSTWGMDEQFVQGVKYPKRNMNKDPGKPKDKHLAVPGKVRKVFKGSDTWAKSGE